MVVVAIFEPGGGWETIPKSRARGESDWFQSVHFNVKEVYETDFKVCISVVLQKYAETGMCNERPQQGKEIAYLPGFLFIYVTE